VVQNAVQGLLARKAGMIDQFVASLLSLVLSVGHRLHDTYVTSGEQADDETDYVHIASSPTSSIRNAVTLTEAEYRVAEACISSYEASDNYSLVLVFEASVEADRMQADGVRAQLCDLREIATVVV
jgi:hypothetical protein